MRANDYRAGTPIETSRPSCRVKFDTVRTSGRPMERAIVRLSGWTFPGLRGYPRHDRRVVIGGPLTILRLGDCGCDARRTPRPTRTERGRKKRGPYGSCPSAGRDRVRTGGVYCYFAAQTSARTAAAAAGLASVPKAARVPVLSVTQSTAIGYGTVGRFPRRVRAAPERPRTVSGRTDEPASLPPCSDV